jgi:hypothetical protein
MKLARMTAAVAAALALSGCALSSYCEGELKYQRAPSVPPLRTAEGLQLPQSGSALRIPPPPENPVPYGEKYKDAEGDDAVRCLDRPPELVRSPEPPEPAATAAEPPPGAPDKE